MSSRKHTLETVEQSIGIWWRQHGIPPRLLDIAELSGYCRTAVENALVRLEADGRVTCLPGRHRSIVLTADRELILAALAEHPIDVVAT